MNKFTRMLQKVGLTSTPREMDVNAIKNVLNKADQQVLARTGLTTQDLQQQIAQAVQVSFDRQSYYQELEKSVHHPLMSSALELYADSASQWNPLRGATMWCTSENSITVSEVEKLFDNIELEEKIFDWTWNAACYGDMFGKIKGQEGVGVFAIMDDIYPLDYGRLDIDGRLLGFYHNPMSKDGQGMGQSATQTRLIPPWEMVHFRLLGAKKKRDHASRMSGVTSLDQLNFLTPGIRRLSTKYGVSVLNNALPAYKRLRLIEDSVLMSRVSKSVLKYIWKVKVSGSNIEAVTTVIDNYKVLLQRARSLDTQQDSYADNYNPLGGNEDVILPVFGESADDVKVEKIGGDPNIRFIEDQVDARNQLACALRIPLQILGGYQEETTGALGGSSVSDLDVRFARTARKLQRCVITGVKKIAQVHLAYLGYSPDPRLFDLHMNSSSSRDEKEMQEALQAGVEVIAKFIDTLEQAVPKDQLDRIGIIDYFNDKLLKLNDFNLKDFIITTEKQLADSKLIGKLPIAARTKLGLELQYLRESAKSGQVGMYLAACDASDDSDLNSHLPVTEAISTVDWKLDKAAWEAKAETCYVKEGGTDEGPALREGQL